MKKKRIHNPFVSLKRLINIFVLLVFSGIAYGQSKSKVVIVIADGIPADAIERLKPTQLMKIAQAGVYKRMYVGGEKGSYKETPTISAPGYMNMLTGTWAYKHNVWDNDNQKPNYHYPTIFSVVRNARADAKLGIFSTWVENRKTLLGANLPQTDHLQLNEIYDGYEKDTVMFRHDSSAIYLQRIDDYVVRMADSVIRLRGPDLSWIYLEYTDEIAHRKGTGKEFDSSVLILDQQVKFISDAIHFREQAFKEKWLLLITTDHGRDSLTGHGHGGQSERERTTWVVFNQKETNTYFESYDPAIVDIFPTVARFLNITIPENIRHELDGVSMMGQVSVARPRLYSADDQLKVGWRNFGNAERVSVYISYTDHFKTGGKDDYQLLGKSAMGADHFEKTVPGLSSRDFYKVIVRGRQNEVNIWHVSK